MNNSEILGLHRITKKHLKDLCKKHKLYQTPHLNDQLYLHFQGFQSIENLEEYTGLKCLWLESNAISEIQGLDCQTQLKCLFLQNNLIKKIENLQCCTLLDTLNLSSNHITKIENCGIDILPELSTLNISRNYLRNSDAIRELLNCKQLWSLDLSHNRIDDILVVKIFAKMPELRVLVLQGNPVVSKVPQYRKTMILECKNLTFLDSRPVFPKDRACAEAWKRGGYEEERKEHDRWNRMDRKKTRDSVNATLRLRQKHGAGDIQLLESSDDENDKNEQNMLRKEFPEDGTSSGDLEIIGVIKEDGNDLTDPADSLSSTSSADDFSKETQENVDENETNQTYISKNANQEKITQGLSNNNEFEEQLMKDEGFTSSIEIVEYEVEIGLNKELKIEGKSNKAPCEDINKDGREDEFEKPRVFSELENNVKNVTKYCESSLEIEEVVVCNDEDQESFHESGETNKENDSSSLSLLNSDFSEHNESTKIISTSSSSDSSFKQSSCNETEGLDTKIEEGVFWKSKGPDLFEEPKESSLENDSSFLSLSNTDFSEHNESTKSISTTSSDSSFKQSSDNENEGLDIKMEEAVFCGSRDQELFQESKGTNKENDSTFLSLSTDFSTSSYFSSSSSSFEQSSVSDSENDSSGLEMEEFKDQHSKASNSACLSLTTIKLSEQTESNKTLNSLSSPKSFCANNSSKLEVIPEILDTRDENLSNDENLNANVEPSFNRINNSPSTPLTLSEINTQTNLPEPLNDIEKRLRNIFSMVLTDDDSDDSLDISAGPFTDQSKTQKVSCMKRSSNVLSLEDNKPENIFNEEQVLDERTKSTIWHDRSWELEDVSSSNWLENLLVQEDKKENSPLKKLVEEEDNNDSCLAVYDSTEDTVASDYLETYLYGDKLDASEDSFANILEETAFSDKEEDGPNKIVEEITENSVISKDLEDEQKCVLLNLASEKVSAQKVTEQNPTNIALKEHSETDSNAKTNEGEADNECTELPEEDKEMCESRVQDDLLEKISQSSSWWERTLAAARREISKVITVANKAGVENIKVENEILSSADKEEVFEQVENNISKVPILDDQKDASNFLKSILEKIVDTEVEEPLLNAIKEYSQNSSKQDAEVSSGCHNSKKSLMLEEESIDYPEHEDDSSYSNSESSQEDPSTPVSTLRGVITSFNEVAANVSSRNPSKSQLLKELIANPITKTFSSQTGDDINRQIEELKQQKREQVLKCVDYVNAQKEKYDDSLDVVDGRLMVVKRSTGALEELPPPQSQRVQSTKYISRGVSTTPTSCTDDDDIDSDDYGTALSEDNDNDDDDDYEEDGKEERKHDIEQHASDMKIKSSPYSVSEYFANYCGNESVSLSSSGLSTEMEMQENNNHHHLNDVDDSQQSTAGGLHNEIDSEVLPELSKWLEKEEDASASGPADCKLSIQEMSEGGVAQTRSEFQVQLNDSIQSFVDFGEHAAALEDIELILKSHEVEE